MSGMNKKNFNLVFILIIILNFAFINNVNAEICKGTAYAKRDSILRKKYIGLKCNKNDKNCILKKKYSSEDIADTGVSVAVVKGTKLTVKECPNDHYCSVHISETVKENASNYLRKGGFDGYILASNLSCNVVKQDEPIDKSLRVSEKTLLIVNAVNLYKLAVNNDNITISYPGPSALSNNNISVTYTESEFNNLIVSKYKNDKAKQNELKKRFSKLIKNKKITFPNNETDKDGTKNETGWKSLFYTEEKIGKKIIQDAKEKLRRSGFDFLVYNKNATTKTGSYYMSCSSFVDSIYKTTFGIKTYKGIEHSNIEQLYWVSNYVNSDKKKKFEKGTNRFYKVYQISENDQIKCFNKKGKSEKCFEKSLIQDDGKTNKTTYKVLSSNYKYDKETKKNIINDDGDLKLYTSNMQTGDILVGQKEGTQGHVMLYIGDGLIVHSTGLSGDGEESNGTSLHIDSANKGFKNKSKGIDVSENYYTEFGNRFDKSLNLIRLKKGISKKKNKILFDKTSRKLIKKNLNN